MEPKWLLLATMVFLRGALKAAPRCMLSLSVFSAFMFILAHIVPYPSKLSVILLRLDTSIIRILYISHPIACQSCSTIFQFLRMSCIA